MTTEDAVNQISLLYSDMQEELTLNIANEFDVNDINGGTIEWYQDEMLRNTTLKNKNTRTIQKFTRERLKLVNELSKGLGSIPRDALSDEITKLLDDYKTSTNNFLNLTNTKALESANNTFLSIINKSYLEVDTGLYSYTNSIRKACRSLADNGIKVQTYASGRTEHIESAVRREVLTTSFQTSRSAQEIYANENDLNVFEVSSHVGARPLCAEDQGKLFGDSDGYIMDLDDNRIKVHAISSSSIGQPAGLFGINCSHMKYYVRDGLFKQSYFPQNEAENKKVYEDKQEQRRLERNVRDERRRVMVADASSDKEEFIRASVRLKEKEATLKTFVNKTKYSQTPRVTTTNFDKSISQKAVWANRKAN